MLCPTPLSGIDTQLPVGINTWYHAFIAPLTQHYFVAAYPMKAFFVKPKIFNSNPKKKAPQVFWVDNMPILVTRKKVKNLNLAIQPPNGEVKISVPYFVSDLEVERFIRERMTWILEKRQSFIDSPRARQKQFIDGEEHSFYGEIYPLKLIECSPCRHIEITPNNELAMYLKVGDDLTRREKLMDEWYRDKLKTDLPLLLEQWQPVVGKEVAQWGVKKMKTRWGSCNIAAKRIWLNLELAKYPIACIEYVLVHELVHLYERYHNDRFKRLMTQFLPDWQERKNHLNKP